VANRASASVTDLVSEVSAVVHRQGDVARTMSEVSVALGRFLKQGRLEERFEHPHPGLDVTTYLLYAAPDGSFSIAALVVRPGARTPIHDHQTWTVWGSYHGRDREVRYERHDRGAESFPELVPVTSRVLSDGHVSLVPPPPYDIHRVENVGEAPSVSIHVHGADMSRQVRNAYDPQKKTVTSFVQSYEEATGE
jgi:predicted metal-dependent enzyme (double-stranded beta helix superfamily)